MEHRARDKSRTGRWLVPAITTLTLLGAAAPALGGRLSVPLVCTKGPSDQHYDISPVIPASVAPGATFTMRIDGVSSGTISQTGLHYIHDMTYEYLLPEGASYVDGSARIVPGTGTANVQKGARVAQSGGKVTLTLPGRVEEGTAYTPPSFEVDLKAPAAGGASLALRFAQYRVTANAIVIGDVGATCDPKPKPFVVGTTAVR
jgi:hypothetical protein